MSQGQRKSRGRSKLGCTQCRKRRVKCDENTPTCKNCSRKGLVCEGTRQLIFASDVAIAQRVKQPKQATELIPTGVSPFASRTAREIRAFQWIVQKTAADTNNPVDRNFWAKVMPRVAQSDNMVWYGMIALSCLYEHPMSETARIEPFANLDSQEFYRRQALEWYGRSLRNAHEVTTRTTPILTLAAFLFSCLEMLQGRPQLGLKLMHQAFQINKGDQDATSAEKEVLEAVLPFLFRSLLPLSTFGFDLSEEEMNRAKLQSYGDSNDGQVVRLMIELYDIIYPLQRFCNEFANTSPDEALLEQKQQLIARLDIWRHDVDTSGMLQNRGEARRFLAQHLVVYYASLIRIQTLWNASPAVFDAYEEHFSNIVSEADKCLALVDLADRRLPLDLAVVAPLFYATWACRSPQIRRKALALLRDRAPREENIWDAEKCIEIMERAIAYEEGTNVFIEDVPAEANVYPPIAMRLPESQGIKVRSNVEALTGVPTDLSLLQLPFLLSNKVKHEWPIPAVVYAADNQEGYEVSFVGVDHFQGRCGGVSPDLSQI